MLNQEQLLELCTRQNIPLNGRKQVERIRESDPVRRVGGGTHNVTTRFASRKMGCVIQAESHKGELPAIYEWEHDPDTHEFYDQPSSVKLSYINGGGRKVSHYSTPDFFLIQQDWMGWVECKPEEKLLESHASGSERYVPDEKGDWCCPPGKAYASQYGLGFKVMSSKEINWVLVRNLEFLSDYLDPGCPPPSQSTCMAIYQYFGGERWILLQRLLEQDGMSADHVLAMIAYGGLIVDMERELLSEPGFTTVCQDDLGFQVYCHQKHGITKHAIRPLPKVQMVPGSMLNWDGCPWKILNVGMSDIYLEDSTKAILSLKLEVFQDFVMRGEILGLQPEASEQHSLAEQVLKKAAPIDLEAAVRRISYLDGSAEGATIIPPRTLRYWRKKAEEGERAFGNRLAGVVTRISARGNRDRKVDSGVIAIMGEVIDNDVLVLFQPKITVCYGKVRNLCEERGLQPPSDKTFRAEIKKCREEAVLLARQGRRAVYGITEFQWHLDQSTPRHGERPFEIGHIDHTELDIELVDSRSGANLGRPWLTILIDAFTRMILAFFLSFDPPSYRSCMAVIRNAVQRHGRISKTIVVDQGSDFESLYFEALLARLGSHKKSRPAAKGRFGSVIERFFGVNNQTFIHNLAGNSQALQRPRSMSPSHDPRKLAVWTLPILTARFEDFIDNVYANLHHPALGMSPKDAMARGLALSGKREHVLISFTEDFKLLCMPTTIAGKAVVRPGRGIKIKGIQYWAPAFRDPGVERTKVPLVYDPFDVSRAYAFVGDQWVLCRSEYQSLLERRTEREIAVISQEIRALHHLAETRRGAKAQHIAAFIGQARESESMLLQQRRDAERRAAEQQPETPPVLPTPKPHPDAPVDLWSEPIAIEIFEELK